MILGWLCSIGCTLSLKEVIDWEDPLYLTMTERMIKIRTLYLSLSSDKLQTVFMTLGFAIVIYFAWKNTLKIWQKLLFFIVAACFSIWQLIAYTFKAQENWDLIIGYPINELRATIRGIAFTVICYFVLVLLYEIASRWLVQIEQKNSKVNAESVILFAGLMLLAWMPYFVMFYPGVSNEDTIIQMMQHFSIPSYINDMSPALYEDSLYTNHHPYALTVLFGWFFDLGIKLGDLKLGIACYTLLHMIFIATTFSVALNYMRHVGVAGKRVYAVLILLMIFPSFPMYAICMVKDTLYTAFALYMILMMWEVSRTKGEILGKWWFNALMFADALLMMLCKVYGVYVMCVVLVYYLIRYWRKCIHVLASILIPIVLFQGVYIDILLPAWHVAPGGKQEALSVPFQQTARYIVYYGDEVTDEEKEAIDAILPYNKLAKKYNAKLSDPVKEMYNQEATDEDLKAYYKVWWEMFKKHKGVYLEATLNNIYEYFEMNKVSSLVYYEWDTYLQEYDLENVAKAKKAAKKAGEDQQAAMDAVETYEEYYVIHDEGYAEARYAVQQWILTLERLPFVSIFASIGLLPWILAFFVLYAICKKKYRYLSALLIPVLTVCICLLSPDNGNYRYILPLEWSYPFITMLLLVKEDTEEKPGGETKEEINIA